MTRSGRNDPILLSAPEAGDDERAMLLDALDSNWLAPLGPHVDQFEREGAARVGVRHGVALSSGTAAIDLGLRLAGVGRGDRVIVPTMTFVGTVSPVVHMGATPVFIDSEASTWGIDPTLLAEMLHHAARTNELPAAVVSVDLYGQCADYGRIEAICAEYGVPLIDDAAEALGASWSGRPAGGFGSYGVLSFNGNKIITTSGGGMLLTNDEAAAERARYLATQARLPAPHYEHSEMGFNYRMSNLCAALGRAQLHGLERKIERRRSIFEHYRSALADLPGVAFMPEPVDSFSTRWLTVMLVDATACGVDRERLCSRLAAADIEARPAWKPMHLQPAFAGAMVAGGSVSECIFRDALCLPSGSGLSDDDVDRVIAEIRGEFQASGVL